MFRELCGDSALGNAVLVTNMWDAVSHEVGEAREDELSSGFFKPVLGKGAQMIRHHGTTESARDAIRKIILMNGLVALRIQQELVDERKDLINTAAGKAINRVLDEQIGQHEAEFERVWEDMSRALKRKDEVTREELEGEMGRLQEQIRQIEKDSEGMAANYTVEKSRMEARVTEMGWKASVANQARGERQRGEAEYNRQLSGFERHRQDMANPFDQANWEQHQAEPEEEDPATMQTLEERTRGLQGQVEKIRKYSEGLEARIEEMEQGAKERELAEAEHKRQLADLTRHLQDEANASMVHRARLEQEVKQLQDLVATVITMLPHPTPYVQLLFYLATHDG